MSVRNQLTHYELEEFFCSLQDLLLLLSLNPSLSFDSGEFLLLRFFVLLRCRSEWRFPAIHDASTISKEL